ncbi:hypothetical protein PGT21_000962 [Puccinia graminis f. sp. tritici]|uniref:Uncharacterized protein n=1 Tax=Puccinia graminis f. sp. tritici TaxID=56615 RepID=A0A5B0P332_PUCGR|nr:hypothetical protein PGT21_000962 [Puccinia graminis f. sp. tritici]KAA1135081.1 hypothetical protein PGTUg99_003600 [Puccinia graminis f. sp. tritici]
MLLSKILVAFQILHYYDISAHPLSLSNHLVKRSEKLEDLIRELKKETRLLYDSAGSSANHPGETRNSGKKENAEQAYKRLHDDIKRLKRENDDKNLKLEKILGELQTSGQKYWDENTCQKISALSDILKNEQKKINKTAQSLPPLEHTKGQKYQSENHIQNLYNLMKTVNEGEGRKTAILAKIDDYLSNHHFLSSK